MTDDELVVHYTLLQRHNPEDEEETRRYKCSECSHDVFILDMHAKLDHGTTQFDVDENEVAVEHDSPWHPCGFLGCTFEPHPHGKHSWQS